jgi:hypothetical protein
VGHADRHDSPQAPHRFRSLCACSNCEKAPVIEQIGNFRQVGVPIAGCLDRVEGSREERISELLVLAHAIEATTAEAGLAFYRLNDNTNALNKMSFTCSSPWGGLTAGRE